MKKIIVGGIFLICGVILYLGIHIPASHFASKLGGWTTPPGRLGTALNEMGVASAANYSVILIISGIILLLWGCFVDEIVGSYKKYKNERNNAENVVIDEKE